ncbi:Glutamate 5-kinase [Streptomyces fumanus]
MDGVYDGDPARPGTSRIAEVRGPADLAGIEIGSAGKAGVGTGGMVTKVEAARIAAAAGIPVVLTSAVHAADALTGQDTGTWFHPTGKRSADRLLWLQHASAPQGALTLDDGAVRAVVERRKSLLPAGIAAVEGEFSAGDPVELRDGRGRAVARGLVTFDDRHLHPEAARPRPDGPAGTDQHQVTSSPATATYGAEPARHVPVSPSG